MVTLQLPKFEGLKKNHSQTDFEEKQPPRDFWLQLFATYPEIRGTAFASALVRGMLSISPIQGCTTCVVFFLRLQTDLLFAPECEQ